jgi:hypothetical protein
MIGALAGALLGGAAGYLISKHVSKFTGGVCPIMCNPKIAIPYFAFIGLMMGM